jgi:exodeoxyribonuclease VII large subunit
MDITHYDIKELNTTLIDKFNVIINKFPKISLKGEIIECKLFKNNCGICFKIVDGNNIFNCKAWKNKNININNIKSLENTTCLIFGNITQNYFASRFDFSLELTDDIINENNDSKIKKLKELCEKNDYFNNKKNINWQTIMKIGIISKKNTQGYNDFMKQFNIPIDIILEEIVLEGINTEKSLINAISNLQNSVDIILIMRGGGSTSDISNSFDTFDIYKSIRNSNIPIITAIGHEDDKDDKLLITNISDLNFSTPSSCALELNEIFLFPILNKLNKISDNLQNQLTTNINNNKKKEYIKLKSLFEQLIKIKFGGIIIKINENEQFIIIQKNNQFYKNQINFNELMNITENDINIKNEIDLAIINHNIDIIKTNLIIFIKKDKTKELKELKELIDENIKNIEKLNKSEQKMNKIKPEKHDNIYCESFDLNNVINNTKNKKIIKYYQMNQWYIKTIEKFDNLNENYSENKTIFDYCNSL